MYFSRFAPAVLIAIALAACSSHKTTVLTSSAAASASTSDNGKTTTIDTKEGAVTLDGSGKYGTSPSPSDGSSPE